MKKNNYFRLLFTWLTNYLQFVELEVNKALQEGKWKDVSLSERNARFLVRQIANVRKTIADVFSDKRISDNARYDSSKLDSAKFDWRRFIAENISRDEMEFIANAELDEIMKRFGLKKRAAYNYRMRARVELQWFAPTVEYPKRKWKGGK